MAPHAINRWPYLYTRFWVKKLCWSELLSECFPLSLILVENATSGDSLSLSSWALLPQVAWFLPSFHLYECYNRISFPFSYLFQLSSTFVNSLAILMCNFVFIVLCVCLFFLLFEKNIHTYLTTWLSSCPVAILTKSSPYFAFKILIQEKWKT